VGLRYDVPKAAPVPLRQVQLLVNSVDVHNHVEWLPEWLAQHGLAGEEERAAALREAFRNLILANNGLRIDPHAIEIINRAAERVTVALDVAGRVRIEPAEDALDEVVAIAFSAMVDGTWPRLKACRNCRWCFYDYSPNRSATWCSMELCGNRAKTRAYRRRRRRLREQPH